jgi:hypothetical protein
MISHARSRLNAFSGVSISGIVSKIMESDTFLTEIFILVSFKTMSLMVRGYCFTLRNKNGFGEFFRDKDSRKC